MPSKCVELSTPQSVVFTGDLQQKCTLLGFPGSPNKVEVFKGNVLFRPQVGGRCVPWGHRAPGLFDESGECCVGALRILEGRGQY